MQPQIHFIGHSHVEALVVGASNLGFDSTWTPVLPDSNNQMTVFVEQSHHLTEEVKHRIDSVNLPSMKVASIGGNAHNWVGMLSWAPKFDFYYPGFHERVEDDATVLPFGSVRFQLSRMLETSDITMLRGLFNDYGDIKAHIQSPPPVKSNDIVLEKLDKVFFDKFPSAQIADPWLRLKLWKLHSDCYEEVCRSYGVMYLTVPPEALDDEGFLRPELCDHKSSTHANPEYGQLVARQIYERLL